MAKTTQQPQPAAQVNMGKWISEGWRMVEAEFGLFLLLGFVYSAVLAIAGSTAIGYYIVAGPLEVGFFYIIFERMRGKPVEIGGLGKGFEFFAPAVLASIVMSVFISIGFVLCIIPGLLAVAVYQFTMPFILDKKMDFWQAMEASRKLLSQYMFEMTIFILVKAVIAIIGLLFCCVGIFAAIPVVMAATAFAYKDLVGLEAEK
ncbi:hypothetical protein JXO59_13490 [candidate division KSB1 bacterium]|nr:hypothetical protein [candidate division KSB1 bacterium]